MPVRASLIGDWLSWSLRNYTGACEFDPRSLGRQLMTSVPQACEPSPGLGQKSRCEISPAFVEEKFSEKL